MKDILIITGAALVSLGAIGLYALWLAVLPTIGLLWVVGVLS